MTAQIFASGHYYETVATSSLGANALTNQQLRLHPVTFYRRTAITKLTAEVTLAGESGSKYRLGIYNDSNGLPGTVFCDGGQIDGTSATVQEVTVAVTCLPGTYWFGGAVQSASTTPPTMRTTVWHGNFLTDHGTSTPAAGVVNLAGVSMNSIGNSTLPTFTFGATASVTPRMFFKVA